MKFSKRRKKTEGAEWEKTNVTFTYYRTQRPGRSINTLKWQFQLIFLWPLEIIDPNSTQPLNLYWKFRTDYRTLFWFRFGCNLLRLSMTLMSRQLHSAEYSTHVHANESLCSALLCMYYESLTFSHQSASLSKHSKPEIPIIGLYCMLSKERLDTELTEAENWPTLCWCLPLHEYGNKLEVFLVLVLFKVCESVNWLFHLILQARRFDFRSVTWFDLLQVV